MFVSKKKYNKLLEATTKLLEQLEALNQGSFLVSIERKGKQNFFTFFRKGRVYQIKTASLMTDDLPNWKKALLR